MTGLGALLISAAPAAALKVGDQVPDLAVPATGGGSVNLFESRGNWTVLFFYPKAFTPGCTSQACGIRDVYQELVDMGVTVYGASVDSLKTQDEFKAKHNLPYALLADSSKALSRAFDALNFIGINKRMTFIINPEGVIAAVIDSVSVGSHDDDVIRMIRELQSKAGG